MLNLSNGPRFELSCEQVLITIIISSRSSSTYIIRTCTVHTEHVYMFMCLLISSGSGQNDVRLVLPDTLTFRTGLLEGVRPGALDVRVVEVLCYCLSRVVCCEYLLLSLFVEGG